MGAVLGVLLRNYGFTDLPPSLPLPRSDPVTRISESKRRRGNPRASRLTTLVSLDPIAARLAAASRNDKRRGYIQY